MKDKILEQVEQISARPSMFGLPSGAEYSIIYTSHVYVILGIMNWSFEETMNLWLKTINRKSDQMLWTRDQELINIGIQAHFSGHIEYAHECVKEEFSFIFSFCKNHLAIAPPKILKFIDDTIQNETSIGPVEKTNVLWNLLVCAHYVVGEDIEHLKSLYRNATRKYPERIIGAVPSTEHIDASGLGNFMAYEDIKKAFPSFKRALLAVSK